MSCHSDGCLTGGACVGYTFKMLFRSKVCTGVDHLCKSMQVGILGTACVCKERMWRCKWHRHFIGYTWQIASSVPGSNFNNGSKDYSVSDPAAEEEYAERVKYIFPTLHRSTWNGVFMAFLSYIGMWKRELIKPFCNPCRFQSFQCDPAEKKKRQCLGSSHFWAAGLSFNRCFLSLLDSTLTSWPDSQHRNSNR